VRDVPERMPPEVRRRLEAVFGEVLPATTEDERDDRGAAEPAGSDERLLGDRPPHHDRG
jgi:hypothetical protein